MPLYPTILCAIDFSEHSRRALRLSLDFARRGKSRVIALHVIDFLLAEAAASIYDERRLKEDAASELAAFIASEQPGGQTMETEILVEIGRVDRVILSSATRHGAALIAMGTQ